MCHKCKKRGHLARVCRSVSKGRSRQWKETHKRPTDTHSDDEEVILHVCVNSVGVKTITAPYKVELEVDGEIMTMEIDTGAAVSLISQKTYFTLFPNVPLMKPSLKLTKYTAEPIRVVGQINVQVNYKGYVGNHDLHVVEGNGPTLLGRDWLSRIQIDWASIKLVGESVRPLDELVAKYAEVFDSKPGAMTKHSAHLLLKPGAQPCFCRPRSVPFAIRDIVGKELDRLEDAGVLRKVEHAQWATPIVPVPKRDGCEYAVTTR